MIIVLNIEINNVGINDLLIKLKNVTTSENINHYSTLTSFTKTHL